MQLREKERKLAEQAQLEKLEFERILQVQAEADARDREQMEVKHEINIGPFLSCFPPPASSRRALWQSVRGRGFFSCAVVPLFVVC